MQQVKQSLQGWFFVEGSVQSFVREMYPERSKPAELQNEDDGVAHAWLHNIELGDQLRGAKNRVAIPFWCSTKKKKSPYVIEVASTLALALDKNKALQAMIDAGPTAEPNLQVMTDAAPTADVTADTAVHDADEAVVTTEVSANFEGSRYAGRYADHNEGAGTMNKLKHVCRAIKCRDWEAASELVWQFEHSNEVMAKLLDGWGPETSCSSGTKRQRR